MTKNIENFQNISNKLINTNFLVFDSEVTSFLKKLTSNEEYLEIIKNCNSKYFFYDDWERFNKIGEIIVHNNKKNFIAFVIGLLYKIDMKEISITNFLTKFYGKNNDMQGLLNTFCKNILIPFQNAFIILLEGKDSIAEENKEEKQILDKMNEDILIKTKQLYEKIQKNKKIPQQNKTEILSMLKGFDFVLENKDIFIIKLIWTGLKNTIYINNFHSTQISAIEKLFSLYGINLELSL